MARLISWTLIVLAFLGVASLVTLLLLAREAAGRTTFAYPEALPEEPQLPQKRTEPLVPIEELNEQLMLPRVDSTPTDKHSKVSITAYREAQYPSNHWG